MSSPPQFDERTSQTITLGDGRTLGYAEFGPKDGFPIFHLHGVPGSRFEGKFFESAAFEHNARIITVDRPGVGISSPQPGRTALDHAKDIQSLASHLGISTFSVVGVSGAGPMPLLVPTPFLHRN
jgi:pimeloyl-ACP methyl ester carboxylesterase